MRRLNGPLTAKSVISKQSKKVFDFARYQDIKILWNILKPLKLINGVQKNCWKTIENHRKL
jgi:hypothetical protein